VFLKNIHTVELFSYVRYGGNCYLGFTLIFEGILLLGHTAHRTTPPQTKKRRRMELFSLHRRWNAV